MQNEPDPFITDNGKFYTRFETPLVSGYMIVPIPKGDPVLRWHGPRIHLEKSWWPALKFMEHFVEHEVVLRLFMRADRSEIIIFPLSQIYGTGMSVKEEISQEEREAWAKEGLIEAGTVHSHCNGNAFQSGTDQKDEEIRDGLHLTIGKLKSNQFDIHARMTWTIPGEEKDGQLVRASIRTTSSADLSDWFLFPDYVLNFIEAEPELERDIIKYILTKPAPKQVVYPPAWKDKLLIKQAGPAHHAVTYPDPWPGPGTAWRQPNLSMADDIPTISSSAGGPWDKSKKKENQNLPGDLRKENLIWDLWSEVMGRIADVPVMREAQVAVSDFDPVKRPHLFKVIPQALGVWESILVMLKANNVTEEEFFDTFDHRIS